MGRSLISVGKRGEVLRRRRQLTMMAAAGVSLALGASSARAQYYWVNFGGNWSVTNNWGTDDNNVPQPPPASGGSTVELEFFTDQTAPGYVGSYTSTNDIGNPFTLNSLRFEIFDPGVVTIAGQPLNFAGTNPFIRMEWYDRSAVISAPMQLTSDLSIINSDATQTYTGTSLLISGPISGAGGLAINGSSVYLTGTNTYSGTTTLGGGTLYAAADNTLSPNSTIELSSVDSLLFQVPTAVTIGTTTLDTNYHSQTIGGLSGTGFIDIGPATLTVGGNNESTTFAGAINGDIDSVMNKVGNGALTLTNDVSVEQVNVTGGSLVIGSEFGFAATDINVGVNNGLSFNGQSAVSIGALSGTGNIDISGTVLSTGIGDDSTYSGALSGSGTLVKEGAGRLTLTNSNNSYTGGTEIDAGVVQVFSDHALGDPTSPVIMAAGGVLQFGGSFSLAPNRILTLNGAGGIDTQGFNVSVPQTIGETDLSSVFIKRGTGMLTLSGTNTFSGGADIQQGTLVLANSNAAGTGGAISLNEDNTDTSNTSLLVSPNVAVNHDIVVNDKGTGTTTIGSLGGGGGAVIFGGAVSLARDINVVAGNNTTLDTGDNPGQTRFDGAISGTGGITISGGNMVQFRGGAKTYSGPTHVTGSGTKLSIKEAAASPSASTVNLDSGTTLVLEGVGNATLGGLTGAGTVMNNANVGVSSVRVGNNNASTTFAGEIDGDVAVEKIGTGTFTLSGTNHYTGPTTFTNGVMVGTLSNMGDGSPGNGLIFNGGKFQSSGTTTTGRSFTVNTTGGTWDLGGGTTTLSGTAGTVINGNLTLNSSTNGGQLVLGRSGGFLTIGPNAGVTVNSGASLALSSNIDQLSAGGNRAAVTTNGTGSFQVTTGTDNVSVVEGNGSTTVSTAATLIADHIRQGTLTVNGTARIRANGGNGGVSVVSSLNIGAAGAFDLNDNDLIVDYAATGPNPFVQLQNWVFQGFSMGPDASKTGIISSDSQQKGVGTMLALFDNAVAGLPSFDGINGLDSSTIIGKYTYQGDVNLDGQVDASDYAPLMSHLGQTVSPGQAWLLGDLNFDGVVTPDDLVAIDANLGLGVSHPLSAQGEIAVPEPAGLGLAVGVGMVAMRRRKGLRRK